MHCLQCTKIIFNNSLCNRCWLRLKETIQPNTREVDSFAVHTVWQWPRNHQLKALWLQNLKGEERITPWLDVVRLANPPFTDSVLWIPLPSSGLHNHALGLASAFAFTYGGTLWDGLEITEEQRLAKQQKNKTKAERQNRVIKTRGKAPCTSFKTVCLVDDIITTGSTFRGAFTAIGHPENGLGIALMDRPLLK